MPEINPVRALVTMTGGSGNFFNGVTPLGAIVSLAGGQIGMGASLSTGLNGENVRLDRLLRAMPIASPSGAATDQFQGLWQRTVETIEQAFLDDQSQIDALEVIVSQLQNVINAQAETAATLATVQAGIDLANSRTDPVDGLLSAGSNGVVNISAHNRVYADGAIVFVNAGNVTGFSEGQFVRVYYDDAARMGGAVAYVGTLEEVTQTGTRHVVGGVTIPIAGDPPATGTGTTPPGYVRNIGELD